VSIPTPNKKHRIKDRPKAIFKPMPEIDEGHSLYEQRSNELLVRLTKKIKHQDPIADSELEELKYFPEVYRDLMLMDDTPENLMAELYEVPKVAFDLMTANYSQLSPYIENCIYSSPELVYKLLFWAEETGTKLRFPISFYTQLLLEDLTWAVRWNKETNYPNYWETIVNFFEEYKMTDAGAAYMFLQANPSESAAPYSQVLASSWKFAFLAAKDLVHRGADINVLQEDAIRYPQWAYHFLRDIKETNTEVAMKSLYQNPAWLVEHLTDANITNVEPHYKACVDAVPNHPLIQDLHLWVSRRARLLKLKGLA
jgi:hypothetical protein